MRKLAALGAVAVGVVALGAWWLGSSTEPAREPLAVAAADPYRDIVAPLLELRCSECHNGTDLTGGFNVETYDLTLVGGDTARAVVPGDLNASELFYRVTRSPDDDMFMPAEGKTPLTADQVEVLRWWIAAGAPKDTTIAALAPPPEIERLLAAELEALR